MIRTLIWGGCVSRDTFERLPEEYELTRYIARQSWLSAGHPSTVAELGKMTSPFQIRMAKGDIAGDAFSQIQGAAAEIDLVLIDLVVERLGVVVTADGGVLTRSIDKIRSKAQAQIDAEGTVLDFDSEEFRARWQAAAENLHQLLTESGLIDRTLILAPAWAFSDEQANPTPTSFGHTIVDMNCRYERYYDELEKLGFQVLRVDPTLADSQHKWGPAAFHFHDVTYAELVEGIRALAEGKN